MTTAAPSRQAVEQHRRIVEAILGQLPPGAIARVEIDGLVSDLRLGSAASRSLADHLVAHPDGLVSGHSGGPRTWLHLLNGLADRLPALVARPRCVRCRRTVALFRWTGEQRCCTTCYTKAHIAVCAGCGEVRPAARRDKGGEAICSRCDRRDPSRWEACTSCGKAARVAARPKTGPLCQNCIPKRLYTCAQCGRPGQPARAFTDGGPICNACYRRGKVERCSQCGVVSPYVRARPDTGTALCDSCWHATADMHGMRGRKAHQTRPDQPHPHLRVMSREETTATGLRGMRPAPPGLHPADDGRRVRHLLHATTEQPGRLRRLRLHPPADRP